MSGIQNKLAKSSGDLITHHHFPVASFSKHDPDDWVIEITVHSASQHSTQNPESI